MTDKPIRRNIRYKALAFYELQLLVDEIVRIIGPKSLMDVNENSTVDDLIDEIKILKSHYESPPNPY